MKGVSKQAREVLDVLTAGLGEPGTREACRKVDNAGGAYIPVSVERIGESMYSVCHYVEQNGDLCQDPEMVFWKGPDGGYYPCSIQQAFLGVYREVLWVGPNGPTKWSPKGYRDLVSFAGMWMKNIKAQQGLKKAA